MAIYLRRDTKMLALLAVRLATGEVVDRPTLWRDQTIIPMAVWLLYRHGLTRFEIAVTMMATPEIVGRIVTTMDDALAIGSPEAMEARRRMEALVTKMAGAIIPADAIAFAETLLPGMMHEGI